MPWVNKHLKHQQLGNLQKHTMVLAKHYAVATRDADDIAALEMLETIKPTDECHFVYDDMPKVSCGYPYHKGETFVEKLCILENLNKALQR